MICQGTFHPGERREAEFFLTIPGDSTGGDSVSWFGAPEPAIRLRLCGPCKDIYVVQNGGAEQVDEGSLFSRPQREAERI